MTCNEVSVDLTRGDISAKGRQMRDVNLIRLKQQISSGNFIGIWKRKNTFVNKFYTRWPTIYFWPLAKWSTMTGQIHNGTAISKFRLRDHNRKLYNLYTDRCRHVRFILLVLMNQYLSLCLRYCPEINMAEGFLQIHQVPSLWWVFLLHRCL